MTSTAAAAVRRFVRRRRLAAFDLPGAFGRTTTRAAAPPPTEARPFDTGPTAAASPTDARPAGRAGTAPGTLARPRGAFSSPGELMPPRNRPWRRTPD